MGADPIFGGGGASTKKSRRQRGQLFFLDCFNLVYDSTPHHQFSSYHLLIRKFAPRRAVTRRDTGDGGVAPISTHVHFTISSWNPFAFPSFHLFTLCLNHPVKIQLLTVCYWYIGYIATFYFQQNVS